nr:DNA (cytosine-5-)-methyltransferase [Corynebacterium lactis]
MEHFTSLEICAGAGGQALGLEQAGFHHVCTVENDPDACNTLRLNRDNDLIPSQLRWNVREDDVHNLDGADFEGIDLFAGGVPCPPFSIAGKQLGADDERDLFPKALEIVAGASPKAVLLENVKGLSQPRFKTYRASVIRELQRLGYESHWRLIYASEHGVPQLRPRFVLVALKEEFAPYFQWPEPVGEAPTVGEALVAEMGSRGWPGAQQWAKGADKIAPTLVGGSKKHGGPDVGPSRAREAWAKLGVKGSSIAEFPPAPEDPIDQPPRLTVAMGALIQCFPPEWRFSGKKTAAWRQVGNAFPPPVAKALGTAISSALNKATEPLTYQEMIAV